MSDRNIDFVLRTVEKRGIRFVRLWFTDVLGGLKSFSIASEDLEEAFEEGIGFDGSSVEGFVPQEESDMLAFPDPTTFQILPWRPSETGVARILWKAGGSGLQWCVLQLGGAGGGKADERVAMCKVTGGSAQSGYSVAVYPNGRSDEGGTESATLFVPDIALDADLPTGTWIIGHKALLPATGGDDE